MTSSEQAVVQQLADALHQSAVQAGASSPEVRGADWRLAAVTTVNTDGTVVADGITARRVDTYLNATVGDLIGITQNSRGSWLALGRLAPTTDTEWTTYTPTVSGGGSATWARDGWWQRRGTLVYFEVYISSSTTGSGATPVTISLPSVPFRGAVNRRQSIPGYAGGLSASSGPICALVLAGGSGAQIDQIQNVANGAVTGANITASTVFTINGWYREA